MKLSWGELQSWDEPAVCHASKMKLLYLPLLMINLSLLLFMTMLCLIVAVERMFTIRSLTYDGCFGRINPQVLNVYGKNIITLFKFVQVDQVGFVEPVFAMLLRMPDSLNK
jgi:hypothetical protein